VKATDTRVLDKKERGKNGKKFELLEQLLNNPEQAKKVFVDSLEETQKNLAGLGIELSLNEIKALAIGVADSDAGNELSENELENVAGGARKWASPNEEWCYKWGKKVGRFLRDIWDIAKEFAK